MKKYIMQDFFGAYKTRKYKWNGTNLEFLIVYFAVYFSLNFSKRESIFEWKAVIICASILLPMLFTYLSVYIHPLKLSKMMYLCPMNPEERKEYIYGSYFFKTGFHMVIALLGLCIAIPVSYCDIFSSLQILLNHAMTVVLVSTMQKREKGSSDMNVIGIFIFTIALISNVVEYGIVMDEEPDIMIKVTLIIVFCLIQIPLEISYIKHLKKELKNLVFYENNQI